MWLWLISEEGKSDQDWQLIQNTLKQGHIIELEMIQIYAWAYQTYFFTVDFILLHFSHTKSQRNWILSQATGRQRQLAQNYNKIH